MKRLLAALALGFAAAALAEDYVAPPRTVEDILAVLEQYKPDPAEIEKRVRAADAEPPPGEDHATLAKFYLDRAHAGAGLGRVSRQIADLRMALEHARAAPAFRGGPSTEAQPTNELFLLIELANAEYAGGNYLNALGDVQRAFELAQQQRRPGPALSTLSSLAGLHAGMGDIEGAKERLARADMLLLKLHGAPVWAEYGPLWTANVERARGLVHLAEGRYAAAEAALRKSVQAFDEGRSANLRRYRSGQQAMIPGLYLASRNRTEIRLSLALLQQGRLAEAEAAARSALIKNLGFFGRYSAPTGGSLATLARVLAEQGRFREAGLLAAAAADSIEKSGAVPESFLLANARRALGASLVAQERWGEAIAVYDKMQDGLARDPLVAAQFGRGDVNWSYALVKTGQAPRAIAMLEPLVDTQEKRLGERDRSVAELRGYLAIAMAASGDTARALKEFERAVPLLLEAARDDQASESGGTAAWMRTTNVLEAYLELLSALSKTRADAAAEAFRIADVARGSSVQRALAESAARGAIRDPALADVAREEQDAEHRIGVLSDLLSRLLAAAPEQQLTKIIGDVRRDLGQVRADQARLRRDIESRFPDYAALTAPKPLAVRDVQAVLRPGETLVSVYVAPARTYMWAVPQKGAMAFATAGIGRDALAKQVAHLREALDVADASLANFPKFDLAASQALYAAILQPLEPALAGTASLLVVPHGALGHLPFAVLTTQPFVLKPDEGAAFANYREAPWLIRRLAITQLPSVSTLASLRRAPHPAAERRAFIGIGDPVFTKTQLADAAPAAGPVTRGVHLRNLAIAKTQSTTVLDADADAESRTKPAPVAVANSSGLAQLPPLPDTAQEILLIGEVLHAEASQDVFLRLRASETLLKTMDLAHRRVIAFATHGLVPGDLNGLTQPALALSAPEVVGGTDDGLLTMEEILGLRLDADWVVLSACNTAAGDGAGAEAVSGLGRAFFYAGARALLVSNWPVETTSARMLTTGLFRHQAEDPKLTRAQALRRTMLDLIDGPGPENGGWGFTYAHPMFWAPFSLVGEGAER